jgi:hypothetical protein
VEDDDHLAGSLAVVLPEVQQAVSMGITHTTVWGDMWASGKEDQRELVLLLLADSCLGLLTSGLYQGSSCTVLS